MKSLAQMSGGKTRDTIAVIRLRICATESDKNDRRRGNMKGRDDFTAIVRLARPSAGSFLSRGLVQRGRSSICGAATLAAVIYDSPGRIELRDVRWGALLAWLGDM